MYYYNLPFLTIKTNFTLFCLCQPSPPAMRGELSPGTLATFAECSAEASGEERLLQGRTDPTSSREARGLPVKYTIWNKIYIYIRTEE